MRLHLLTITAFGPFVETADVVQFSTDELSRVPRTFTTAITRIITTDAARAASGLIGTSWPR